MAQHQGSQYQSRSMKKTQRETIPAIEEFEDLTLFANESFDTQDVDLFEFTSEESSPLTRLKSIILSLDWEINDEILQELADELDNLQSMWQGDKVAEVYLQGLSKIGNYIRTKGAYAHPNSIKLLLTFFYNFEKIISSQNITGEQITQLLKGDVRKFKILQYQINQSEDNAPKPVVAKIEPSVLLPDAPLLPPAESNAAKQLKATILSLDWEVTDDSLAQFNAILAARHQQMTENKPALVLLQGLQALSDYIAEERADAHPEAFTLLHSFNEALEQVSQTDGGRLDQADVQELLVDRINRLNTLKMLITNQSVPPVDEQLIDDVVEEISAPSAFHGIADQAPIAFDEVPAPIFFQEDAVVEYDHLPSAAADASEAIGAEIDTLFAFDAKPAMETADMQYPDEILPSDAIHPVADELADDFIEAHLSANRGLMPALFDTDELSGFNEASQPLDLPAQSDLSEQLDFLFADAEKESEDSFMTLSAQEADSLKMAIEDNEPVAALANVDADFEFAEDAVVAALNDAEQPADSLERNAQDVDVDTLDIQSKLDNFFADAMVEPVHSAAEDSVEEIEQSLFFDAEHSVQAALADSAEEQGFSEEEAAAALNFTPIDEIAKKLDFFFGADSEEEPKTEITEEAAPTLEPFEEEDAFEIAPALSGFSPPELSEGEEPATVVDDDKLPDETLEGALDLFFDAVEEETEPALASADDALTEALEATLTDAVGSSEEGRQVQLAALGALLPFVVRTPSHDKMAEAAEFVASLQQAGLSSEQQALLQLLNSVIAMLMRLPAKNDAATEKLVNYLYEQLLLASCPAEALPEAISRFTAWLQQASAVMPLVPAATDAVDGNQQPQFAYTAKELYFELSALRLNIKEEFAKLRHDLHHHNH